MARTLLLIGTRKGCFLLESDADRRDWTLRGPFCEGWPVYHAIHDPATGSIYAAAASEWHGSAIWRTTDLGENWELSSEGLAYDADSDRKLSKVSTLAVNNGRLPVGVRAGAAGQGFDVGYLDTVTPTISADPATGVVLGVDLRLVRTVQVSVPSRGSVSAGTVLDASAAADPSAVARGLTTVADLADRSVTQQVVGQVLPGLLVVFALVLLAFGLPKLRRRPGSSPDATAPARAPDPAEPDTVTVPHLADAGVVAPPRD